ncbi:TetR/AcrR family transcriptional regulator [Patulibacter americanus]|uniref:TetR/AcrR family transcriptional regulator n=1 Tax=Patulibacter americanus TaxID=588672 RepID=UPI0003B4A392|nr:TetR/AcrR family transcriptional regulator [Patulibacter americanus]
MDSSPPSTPTPRPSPARDRLLTTASRIFYAEGIHGVGVEHVIAEAQVTRATFYRHFAGKEALIEAYLRTTDEGMRARAAEGSADGAPPRELVLALMGKIGDHLCTDGFRGCPFINAAAEYPDPESPVRRIVADHRAWFHDTLQGLLEDDGHPDPTKATRVLVQLRDGAMVGGYLDDPAGARRTLLDSTEDVLAA